MCAGVFMSGHASIRGRGKRGHADVTVSNMWPMGTDAWPGMHTCATRSGNGQAAQDGGCAARAVHCRGHNAARIAGALAGREQPRVAHTLARLGVPHDAQLQHAQAAPSVGYA